MAVLDPAQPMRPGLRYKVGSITKMFAATLVLQLAAEHTLGLGDPVARWLPGLVPNGGHITIRQLLQHTSGLFDYAQDSRLFEPYLRGDLGFVWSPRQLVALATEHPPLFATGTSWSYSNTTTSSWWASGPSKPCAPSAMHPPEQAPARLTLAKDGQPGPAWCRGPQDEQAVPGRGLSLATVAAWHRDVAVAKAQADLPRLDADVRQPNTSESE